jgi:hypothetical protein
MYDNKGRAIIMKEKIASRKLMIVAIIVVIAVAGYFGFSYVKNVNDTTDKVVRMNFRAMRIEMEILADKLSKIDQENLDSQIRTITKDLCDKFTSETRSIGFLREINAVYNDFKLEDFEELLYEIDGITAGSSVINTSIYDSLKEISSQWGEINWDGIPYNYDWQKDERNLKSLVQSTNEISRSCLNLIEANDKDVELDDEITIKIND